MTAGEALAAALFEQVSHHQPPPCADGTDRWLSDSRVQRTQAAHCCQTCRLLTLCQDLAAEVEPSFGVWAAHDYTPKPMKARTR